MQKRSPNRQTNRQHQGLSAVHRQQARAILVIPSVDGGHLLERMLPTLRVAPASVVVLDQGSTDNTVQVCRAAGVELLQLGRPYTYTQACNIGARLARQRGYPFLCVANNDIVFRSDVISDLLAEMDNDPKLGVVAPSQVILDPANEVDVLARRVAWNLDVVEFLHDLDQAPVPPRLEADFCEFTCVLLRMEAILVTGFLDDAYGFYYEDADFGFRLRKAGYGAAYLPRSQIYHLTSSTFSRKRQEQLEYVSRNRVYFAKKHLGYGVRQHKDGGFWGGQSGIFARRLYPELRRFGLIDDAQPDLVVGSIGPMTSGYLLVPGGPALITGREAGLSNQYRAVLATSVAAVDRLRTAGFESFRIPAGIDPDIFNPWSVGLGEERRFDETTYLALVDPFDRRPVAGLLRAWGEFASPKVRLIVAGMRLGRLIGHAPDAAYRSGRAEVSWYAAERIELRETEASLDDRELAALYRSVDFTIVLPGPGSSVALAESIACGRLVVFDAACKDLAASLQEATGDNVAASLTAGGAAEGLLPALRRSEGLSDSDRASLAVAARYGVLGHSTLRHTAMAVRDVLEMTQERNPDRFIRYLDMLLAAVQVTAPVSPARQLPQVPAATRMRLSKVLSRRFIMAGANAMHFGENWQRNGLPTAMLSAATHMRPARRQDAETALIMLPLPTPAEPEAACIAKADTPLLIGYIDAQLGIGQSLRGLATAIADTGTEFSIYPFGVGVEGRRSIPTMPERHDKTTPHDVNIIEVSPAELPRVFSHITSEHFDNSYNILRTYWELAKGPAIWRDGYGMERIHEMWAPNEFCATAFRDFFDGPIFIVPPCLEVADLVPSAVEEGKKRFGLDPHAFHFMFSFDYYSFSDRKNPLAAVRAFLTAFPDRSRPVGLVVKATSAENHFPAVKKEIIAAAEADGRITIIDESLSRADMLSLMAGIDCYVSLHRSEGFGLGMAEAMAMSKPVIATGYSGNSEFVTERTGYPVPFELKPVRRHEYVHTEGQVWADPDEDACAAAMRAVIERPEEAAARAEAGHAFVKERYGKTNVGRIAAKRLAEISQSRAVLSDTRVGLPAVATPPAAARNSAGSPP